MLAKGGLGRPALMFKGWEGEGGERSDAVPEGNVMAAWRGVTPGRVCLGM